MSGCFDNLPGIPLSVSACPQGWYCPNVLPNNQSTFPVQCNPSKKCATKRLTSFNCDDEEGRSQTFGSQGLYEPVICPPGYVCETPSKIQKCPKGFFCPTGTFEAHRCDFISICPEGTVSQISLVGMVFAIVIDLILVFGYLFISNKEKIRRLVKGKNATEQESKNATSLTTLDTLQRSAKTKNHLAANFKNSFEGADLKMHFEMDHLGFKLPNGKEILKGVTGHIHAGRMTAIMGPSGAGKTTFLNVLCGKVNRTHGVLKISGKETEVHKFKKICGFVPQEDVMHRGMTVRENILHSARMRAPKDWTAEQVNNHVQDIIQGLQLDHVSETAIGNGIVRGISGGQRKRVNIGIELAATPLCLFLDEPTSGLDSTSSLEVMDMLDKISDIGVTVIAVIHQPRVEIFTKFHDVLMIAPGGRTAYLGPSAGARGYFENLGYEFPNGSNDADILMDILSGHGVNKTNDYTVDQLVENWSLHYEKITVARSLIDTSAKDEEFHSVVARLTQKRGAGLLKQIYFAHNFSLWQQYRDFMGFFTEILTIATAGVIMGLALSGRAETYIGIQLAPFSLMAPSPILLLVCQISLFTGAGIALAAAPAGVKIFSEELEIYWRNASSGHSPLAYFIAKNIASLYRIALNSLHFSAILFVLAQPVTAYYQMYIYSCLMFYGIYGMSHVVSMFFRRESATLVGTVVGLFATAFCGYGITVKRVNEWNLGWLYNTQFALFGGEAMYSNTLDIYRHVYDVDLGNAEFQYTLGRAVFDYGMMFLIGSIWRVAAYYGMIFMNRDKQK